MPLWYNDESDRIDTKAIWVVAHRNTSIACLGALGVGSICQLAHVEVNLVVSALHSRQLRNHSVQNIIANMQKYFVRSLNHIRLSDLLDAFCSNHVLVIMQPSSS